ncbi:MAG: hypothetical protein LBD45_06540 [Bacteroidales bacterium]|jgi:uncharacterized protein YoxC|nr:hypothetical protein [Bacteroidales bacterium]
MIERYNAILQDFSFQVERLISRCKVLTDENKDLLERIDSKEKELDEAYNTIKELAAKYENLKLAKIISINDSETKMAKKQLAGLVREIDKCIALLNE